MSFHSIWHKSWREIVSRTWKSLRFDHRTASPWNPLHSLWLKTEKMFRIKTNKTRFLLLEEKFTIISKENGTKILKGHIWLVFLRANRRTRTTLASISRYSSSRYFLGFFGLKHLPSTPSVILDLIQVNNKRPNSNCIIKCVKIKRELTLDFSSTSPQVPWLEWSMTPSFS